MSKTIKWLCTILVILLVFILGFYIYNHVQARQIYHAWLKDLEAFKDTLPKNSYGHLQVGNQEMFFYISENNALTCGRMDTVTGTEQIYHDGLVYTYSAQNKDPVITRGDTDLECMLCVQEITQAIQRFAQSTVASTSLFVPGWFESAVPILSLDNKHTVLFQLEAQNTEFHPDSNAFAHLSRKPDGRSNFVYNDSPLLTYTAPECLLLQSGTSNGTLLGWSGHDPFS